MTTTTASDERSATTPSPRAADDDRWPRLVFGAAAVVAFPLLLWFGRDHWFAFDEWMVLDRPWLNDGGWLEPHNGHWVTVLKVEYRLLFRVFGLHSYLPYQVPVVLAHIGSAILLRVLLRRLTVQGWLATAVAMVFLFFGAGRDNITFGFQISLTGSLLAGLAVLLLADRPGPVARADGWALVVGLVGLMTSAAFVAMVAGAVVAILIRRGWRVAAYYAVPLGLVYGLWYLRYASGEGPPLRPGATALRFAARMLGAIFTSLTAGSGAAVALAAVAAVGVVATVRTARRTGERRQVALLAGLLTAWLVFAAMTSSSRASTPLTADTHDAGRYLHLGAALLLPAVAVGIQYLSRRRTLVSALAVALLAIGVPQNIDRLGTTAMLFTGAGLFGPDTEEIMPAMAHSELIDDVPRDAPLPTNLTWLQGRLTVGWLADIGAAGRLPRPDGLSPEIQLTADNLLALHQGGASPGLNCEPLAPGRAVTLSASDEIRFAGTLLVTVTDGVHASPPRHMASQSPAAVRVLAGPLDVAVKRPFVVAEGQQERAEPPVLCRPGPGSVR
jgi:hypothetical protein